MRALILHRQALSSLIPIFSSAFFTLPALASDAEIEQPSGWDNIAEIVQDAAPQAQAYIYQDTYGNNALIMQSGPAEELIDASITQWGTYNSATIAQSDVETSAVGTVIQGGSGNSVDAVQEGVRSISFEVRQAGDDNTTSIYQSREHGIVDVGQVGDGHYARVEQVGGLYQDQVSIYQEGSQNSIEVLQEEENDGTVISHQIGSNNSTWVHQRVDNEPVGVEAILTTEGNDNTVIVEQNMAWLSSTTLTQTGDGNRVEIDQGGEGARLFMRSMNSNYNDDYIVQQALGNDIVIDREYTDYSSTDVFQTGPGMNIRVEQYFSNGAAAQVSQSTGFDNTAFINQSNVSNSLAGIQQNEASWSEADIVQDGAVNSEAVIVQSTDGETNTDLIASIYQSGTSDSYAVIEQFGSENEAHISQTDTVDNTAAIWQEGTGNFAEIILVGSGANSQSIVQVGDGYSTSIHQGGTNNTAVVTQM